MKINKVHIKNFRSIKDEIIEFQDFFALVWFNCAWKSNILKAINFVLWERYPMWQTLTKKDFYGEDENNRISIEIEFNEEISVNTYQWLKEWKVLTFEFDNSKWNYSLKLKNTNAYLKDEDRKKVACIYISANRDFEKNLLWKSEWSLMWKIINFFNAKFPQSKIWLLNTKFEEIKTILKEDDFLLFEESFKRNFDESMLKDNVQMNLEIKTFDPKSFYKSIEIIPSEIDGDKSIDQLWDWLKNSILFSLIKTYCEVVRESSIFLIEEPEIYLHPQARLDMFNLFKEMAWNWTQIIYSTHSQEIIHTDDFEHIWIVRKIDWETKVTQVKNDFITFWETQNSLSWININQIKNYISTVSDAETNKWFFAKKIILVEWLSEKWSFPIYAKKLWLFFERKNFEIISCNWKWNILTFYNLYKYLWYEIYVIFDRDDSTKDEINKKIIKTITWDDSLYSDTLIINDLFTMFKVDFETEMQGNVSTYTSLKSSCQNSDKKHILQKYIALDLEIDEIPDFIKSILEKIFNSTTNSINEEEISIDDIPF